MQINIIIQSFPILGHGKSLYIYILYYFLFNFENMSELRKGI